MLQEPHSSTLYSQVRALYEPPVTVSMNFYSHMLRQKTRTTVLVMKLHFTPELPSRRATEGMGALCCGNPTPAGLSPEVLVHDPSLETLCHPDVSQVPSNLLSSIRSPKLMSSELERLLWQHRPCDPWGKPTAVDFQLSLAQKAFSVSKAPALAIDSLCPLRRFVCCDLKTVCEFRYLTDGSICSHPPQKQ